jgi:hypothetical protein
MQVSHHRGCQEVVLFLLARPRRITAFLDYLATLPPETITQVDPRVFAELYAARRLVDTVETDCSGSATAASIQAARAASCLGSRRHASFTPSRTILG